MNLKKALQAFLVTVSCGVLNIAGAQQRPVFIPEDYVAEQAQADFVANGPKLLFSDSPETVYNNGILYRDKVEGDVRLFLNHVNGVAGKKKLAVMLKNTDNLRPVTYKVTRSGVAGFNYDYMRDGKNSQKEYFDDSSQKPQDGKLGFGRSHELLSGRGIILPTDKLYTATIDLHFDKPVEVSVLMCETKSDLELFNEAAAIQPMDEHPLRGTFEAADWNYTLKKPVNAPEKPLMLELATSQEGYAKGVDATTGLPAENYGNYGVIYKVNFTVAGKKPISFILNPIGGPFAGYGVLENKTKGERQLLALPESTVCVGTKIEEAIELGKLKAGEYSFIWSPPGASNLPVQLIWEKTE